MRLFMFGPFIKNECVMVNSSHYSEGGGGDQEAARERVQGNQPIHHQSLSPPPPPALLIPLCVVECGGPNPTFPENGPFSLSLPPSPTAILHAKDQKADSAHTSERRVLNTLS